MDVVYCEVEGVPPFSDSFDPSVDLVSFDVGECYGYFPHRGFESQYSHVDAYVG